MREGTLVLCKVTGVQGSDTLLDADGIPALIPGPEHNGRDRIYPGTLLWCVVIASENGGAPRLRMSRLHEVLVTRLLERHIPAIAAGTVRVVRSVRLPGRKTKVAIDAGPDIDPADIFLANRRACSAVLADLRDEAIDFVPFDEDGPGFVTGALFPLQIEQIVLDDDTRTMELLVEADALAEAFGDISLVTSELLLAARLTGWNLDAWESAAYERSLDGDARAVPLASIKIPRGAPAPSVIYPVPEAQAAMALVRHVQAAGIRIADLSVARSGRRATISGVASSTADRDAAQRLIEAQPDIDTVDNAVSIEPE